MIKKITDGLKYWGQLLGLPVYWLSFVVPKDKNLWVFGSTFGRRFADNPKYLYLYTAQFHGDKTKAVWISHNKDIVKLLNDNGYEAYYYHSLKGMWQCLRAKIYIFDNYSKDISFWLSGGAIKFNLWHGSGNKKTNYDNKFDTVRHPKNTWEKFKTFPRRLSDEKPHHYTLATSPMMAKIFTSAFNTDMAHIVQEGYPRNDVLFDDINIKNIYSEEEKQIIRKLQEKHEAGMKIIYYMPTFRASESLFFDVMDLEKFNEFLKENNYMFYTKLHPKSKLKEKFSKIKYSNIEDINPEVDTYVILRFGDMLTTDYSSIYSDYLMLDRPSVLFPYDFEEYSKDTRECYFEYDEYMPEVKTYTMDEFMREIKHTFEEDLYQAGRKELRDRIFAKTDGLSCKRLYDKVCEIIDNGRQLEGEK